MPAAISDELREILSDSFYIRATITRRDGRPRTVEMTFYWDGGDRLYFSGYPGKRDWVATMARHPTLMIHTVEGARTYDIPGRALVLRERTARLPHLLRYIEHWAKRPGYPRWQFTIFLTAIKINRALRLPWWGPFIYARRILDRMPCVEITFTGDPVIRAGATPPLTEPRPDRP